MKNCIFSGLNCVYYICRIIYVKCCLICPRSKNKVWNHTRPLTYLFQFVFICIQLRHSCTFFIASKVLRCQGSSNWYGPACSYDLLVNLCWYRLNSNDHKCQLPMHHQLPTPGQEHYTWHLFSEFRTPDERGCILYYDTLFLGKENPECMNS